MQSLLNQKGPQPFRKRSLVSQRQGTTVRKTCFRQEECRSCAFTNNDYDKSLELKLQAGLKKLSNVRNLILPRKVRVIKSPKITGYRTSVKLAVGPSTKEKFEAGERFAIGLYQPGSHSIVNISQCPVQASPINKLLVSLKKLLESGPLEPYDEKSQKGDIRYLAVRSNYQTTETMLTFIVSDLRAKDHLKSIVYRLQEEGHRVSSAYLNVNKDHGNRIFSYDPSSLIQLTGQKRLRTKMCDLKFELSPNGFNQVNPWQAENIYRRLGELAGTVTNLSRTALDLYCGSGQIASVLAQRGYRVLACEENPSSVKDAEANRALNNLTTSQLRIFEGKVEETLPRLSQFHPSLIIVNPARDGLEESVIKLLAKMLEKSPRAKLVYVSCSIKTLERDLIHFDSLDIRAKQIEAYDMFAHTDQLEWLTVLTAKRQPKSN